MKVFAHSKFQILLEVYFDSTITGGKKHVSGHVLFG